MLSDPICALIGGAMLLLVALSAVRALRTAAAVRQSDLRSGGEVAVAKIVSAEPAGEPIGGEVQVELVLQLPHPAGTTSEVRVVRPMTETALGSLQPDAVVIVEFDPLDMGSLSLRPDVTPPELRITPGDPVADDAPADDEPADDVSAGDGPAEETPSAEPRSDD